jgi:hypothetical protein
MEGGTVAITVANIATVLSSIPASPDTVESEGRQMKQCIIKYCGGGGGNCGLRQLRRPQKPWKFLTTHHCSMHFILSDLGFTRMFCGSQFGFSNIHRTFNCLACLYKFLISVMVTNGFI